MRENKWFHHRKIPPRLLPLGTQTEAGGLSQTKPWWRRLRRVRQGSRFPPGPTAAFSPFLNSDGCDCPSGLDQSSGAVGWVTFIVPDRKDVYEFQPGRETEALRRYLQTQKPAKRKLPRSRPVYLKISDVTRMLGCHPETVLRDIRRGRLALAKRKAGRSYLIARSAALRYFLTWIAKPIPIPLPKKRGRPRRRGRPRAN
jgi:hypothetical protein